MQGKLNFYDIEGDKSALAKKKIAQRKQSLVKDANRSNRFKISIFIHN